MKIGQAGLSTAVSPARFEMRGIRRTFPGVVALDQVDFVCQAGEVHALCGENGAGKSTLMKVLGGVLPPDAGEIRIDGVPVRFGHPASARRAGIAIIHQELSLLPERTVAANIFLGLEPTRGFWLDRTAMRSGAERLLGKLGVDISPHAYAGDLSMAEQQVVEIAKALALDARILVMDEPTAALDEVESARLLDLVRQLRREGAAIVYISHRMPEVFAVADRVTVLKDGRLVGTQPRAELHPDDVVRMMVGREPGDFYPPPRPAPSGGLLLSIRGGGNERVDGIDLDLRTGELVAVVGLEGSGKSELAHAVFGDHPFTRGKVCIGGDETPPRSPREAIHRGIGLLPEDRKAQGLALDQSVRANVLLALRGLHRFATPPGAAHPATTTIEALIARVDVRLASLSQTIRSLSGGNQQKTVLARWLAISPRVLVCAEPTRGVDVIAKAAIYRLLRDISNRGRGVLVVTSDLPEAIGIADRLLVMRNFRIVGELPGGAGEQAVMALATGHAALEAPA